MRYGMVILSAGFSGLLSFCFLAVSVGTDYWYIIDVNKPNYTDSEQLSSYSGLWRINEGSQQSSVIPTFTANMSALSEVERHLLELHKAVVIVLPLGLVLLVFGWIFGLVGSLACSPKLLTGAACYFLVCSLLTLTGVSLYIQYSNKAMEEFRRIVAPAELAYVKVSFGWSFAMAWISFGLELAAGLLLLLAAKVTQMKGRYDCGGAVTL
ncbi:transmembrane protein 235-like [Syngnathoides biaculeatus]|uniref:transmembrane protein 235-like n=1 Tax=Syngnathoides biaculeatus TaxID=300417 RepID=UPI002ADD701E|nr:transmembrane protein 235-like [Syngnathoides biaculeatus]